MKYLLNWSDMHIHPSSPNSSISEENAATKIQANFRGYRVRKQLKDTSSTGTNVEVDGKIDNRDGKSKDEEKSATKIQIIMIDETNGNNLLKIKHSSNLVPSFSNDDISQSQSISEYTDADESMSCPTEFLAEFLSAVMLKDYKKALKYCKLILEFEPNNITAKEFYPLIQEKMKHLSSDKCTENLKIASVPESEEAEELEESDDSTSNSDSDSDYSCASDEDKEPNEEDQNHSNTSSNCTSGSENTTHSYPSSLLEEEDYMNSPSNLEKLNLSPSLSDLNNGNYKTISTSESESPTEPLTQQIVTNLLVKENDI